MNVIKIDLELCNGCQNCYRACWIDVIRWDEANRRPIAAYPEDCVECNYCEISCNHSAIHVIPDYSKPWPNVYA